MNKIKRIHLMGIGGSGMSGVAFLASQMGYEVTGCDLEDSTAYSKDIFKGHDPKHLEGIDLLVVSPAIKFQNSKNPEYQEGLKRGIVMTWEEFVGKYLCEGKKVICIAGTHGKSTTTAMVGKMLIDAGLDPTVLVGAKVNDWGRNAKFGKGECFVIEADEFNNNFLNYHPNIIVLNNIEFDHPDFFKDENDVKESFDKFIGQLKKGGTLITSGDSVNKHFNLKVMGEHNQRNANMVYVLGKKLGIDENIVIKSIEDFEGIGRRMELLADRGGIKVYDDYAHHPTAIKTTLEGVREKYPKAKILVINEPHGYKRTKALLPEYRGVFNSADKVIIGPIFSSRDEVDDSITPEKVAGVSNHKNILSFDSFEKLLESSKSEIGNYAYEVIVVMGAGKSYLWAKEIVKLLPVKFSDLTTFKVGGEIRHFVESDNVEEIIEAINFAKNKNLDLFVLGGGSDILVSDKEFEDVVIKFTGKAISQTEDGVFTSEAGVDWDKFVEYTVDKGFQGLECLSGIPGTVGASPIQNIGAYGADMSKTFESLKALNLEKGKIETFDKEKCKFGYRESVFKTDKYWQKYLIVSVSFRLNKDGKVEANYDSLKGKLPENATIKEVREAVLKVRASKLENPKEHGNAGSFFKNPIIDQKKKEELIKDYPDIKIFPFENKYKVSAGWLIENAGLKGKELGGASVSPKHSLVLINRTGKALAKDVYDLSELVIFEVHKKYGVKLEREVQLINF